MYYVKLQIYVYKFMEYFLEEYTQNAHSTVGPQLMLFYSTFCYNTGEMCKKVTLVDIN